MAENALRSALRRIVPVSSRCGIGRLLLLGAGFTGLGVSIVADALNVVFGLGGISWQHAMSGWVVASVMSITAVLVSLRAFSERRHRILWTLAAAGISSYAVAMLLWALWVANVKHPPDPSICDFFWWAAYPLVGAAIVGAGGRQAQRNVSMKIWLDGLITASATAAVAAVFVLGPVVDSSHAAHQAVFANLLYPLGDVVMGVLLVGVIGLGSWRLDRRWAAFVAAFLLLLGADTANSLQVAGGASIGNSTVQLLYMASFTCMALGAWQPASRRRVATGAHWSTLVLPALFAVSAPALLIYDQFSRIPLGAFVLTMVALLAGMVRLALALRDMLTINELRRAAMTDELTNLPNRRMVFAQLEEAITAARVDRLTLTAMMIDLDNFKQINDTLGHDAGDDLLRLVGPRMSDCMRPGDVIARLGGDEFAVLLAAGSSPDEAAAVADAVLGSLREPFGIHGVTLRLTASIGIATYPDDAQTPEALIKCIDVAMYDAKRSRRGWERYESERDLNTPEKLELASVLARALESREIEAHFQPVVDTVTRQVVAVEALARWRRADGTLRPPAEFLQTAELAGLSRPLTRHMLDLGLRQLVGWHQLKPDLRVAVNATVADLLDESFPDDVAGALSTHGMKPSALCIEVTEGSIVADPVRAGAVLERLHRLGVRIALDDFGTGYSSLTHLRELPVDILKIDRSFVSHMCDESADAAIVYATVELAHRLDLLVVAEGVEDERTWSAVRELNADRVQGYAFSRPVAPEQLTELLRSSLDAHFAESQSLPTPASTASGGSIS